MQVKKGGTISSLFAILCLFTGDIEAPKTATERAKEEQSQTSSLKQQHSSQESSSSDHEIPSANIAESIIGDTSADSRSKPPASSISATIEVPSEGKPRSVFPGLASSPLRQLDGFIPGSVEDHESAPENGKTQQNQKHSHRDSDQKDMATTLPNIIARAATDATLAVVRFYIDIYVFVFCFASAIPLNNT